MIWTYSLIAIVGLCLIIFLLYFFQRRREEEKKRKAIELLTAKSQLETLRDNLNHMRKKLYEVENNFNDDRFYHKAKKEELVQLAKKLKGIAEERDNIKKTMEEGAVDEKAFNLLENRLRLLEENIGELSGKARELQDDVNRLEQSAKENEQNFKMLTNQIAQAERDVDQQKAIVKIKETNIKS